MSAVYPITLSSSLIALSSAVALLGHAPLSLCRARHYAIPTRRRPPLPPLVSTCAASVATDPDYLALSFHNRHLDLGGDAEVAIASPPIAVTEEAPVPLPLDKMFVSPEVELPSDCGDESQRVLRGSNIVLGPYAHGALVSTAEFVKSSAQTKDCPSDGLSEFALVGWSNVGKSSLLNSLVRCKRLALTSKKPDRGGGAAEVPGEVGGGVHHQRVRGAAGVGAAGSKPI